MTSLFFSTAWTFSWQFSCHFFKYSLGIVLQDIYIWILAAFRSLSTWFHAASITLMSSLWGGQSMAELEWHTEGVLHLCAWDHSHADLQQTKLLAARCFSYGMAWWIKIQWHFCVFRIPSILTSSPTLLKNWSPKPWQSLHHDLQMVVGTH